MDFEQLFPLPFFLYPYCVVWSHRGRERGMICTVMKSTVSEKASVIFTLSCCWCYEKFWPMPRPPATQLMAGRSRNIKVRRTGGHASVQRLPASQSKPNEPISKCQCQ
jgi:hypothetical protein